MICYIGIPNGRFWSTDQGNSSSRITEELLLIQNIPSAGHRGWRKTLERLKRIAYWVGMASDVKEYCRSCERCMQAKQPVRPKAPLVNIPIGTVWERVAMDVMEVPINPKGNKYILVVQDYFTNGWKLFLCLIRKRIESSIF